MWNIMAFQDKHNKTEVFVRVCVPEPQAFLSGNLLIDNNTVNCTNCQITNCVNYTLSNFLIVKQPDYVYLPVNLTKDWYDDKGLGILEHATTDAVRSRVTEVLSIQKILLRSGPLWPLALMNLSVSSFDEFPEP